MALIKNILFPVDFSPVPGQNAIRWQKWAWFTGSAVVLAIAFD